MKKKVKRFDDGGVVGNTNYPFGQNGQNQTTSSAPVSTGLGNTSPLVQVNTPGPEVAEQTQNATPFGMKRGGKVKTASRGDGIAQRGKTRGRMV